jgi:hypothetical protein
MTPVTIRPEETTAEAAKNAQIAGAVSHPKVIPAVADVKMKVKQDLRMGREHQEGRVNWITTIAMGAFHVGAIAALFFFSWKNLAVAVVMYFFAINVGIGMAYHRLLTHRGYRTPKWVEYFVTACGTLALEGGRSSGWRRIACITRTPTRRATRIRRMMEHGGRTRAGFFLDARCTRRRLCWAGMLQT